MGNNLSFIAVLPGFFGILSVFCAILRICILCDGKKIRSPQQTGFQASRARRRTLSLNVEPSVYVSPSNYPPPPKYEAMMAPPSYDEVVGIHGMVNPTFQMPPSQPITQPIANALSNPAFPATTAVSTESAEPNNSDTSPRNVSRAANNRTRRSSNAQIPKATADSSTSSDDAATLPVVTITSETRRMSSNNA